MWEESPRSTRRRRGAAPDAMLPRRPSHRHLRPCLLAGVFFVSLLAGERGAGAGVSLSDADGVHSLDGWGCDEPDDGEGEERQPRILLPLNGSVLEAGRGWLVVAAPAGSGDVSCAIGDLEWVELAASRSILSTQVHHACLSLWMPLIMRSSPFSVNSP